MSESSANSTSNSCPCDCACCQDCPCECEYCKGGKCSRASRKTNGSTAISQVRVNETVGASFLGILAILLLIFLVRSNRRNRELLLEVIELQRRA